MSPHLLPDPAHVRSVYLCATDTQITMVACSKAADARCPLCNQSSQRVHSRYTRTLADLPWQGIALQIRLTVRRFFCTAEDCNRRIFTERLPELTAPYARRTTRLSETLELVGFAVGGEAGERLLAGLHILISSDTILRLLRRAPLADHGAPRILGVDDFAFRRGHRYGTIVIDLEQHRVIDLLPDRKPETLTAWLEENGSPEIVTRDRGGGYAEGTRKGAPDAVQVADRFHLLQNLTTALESFFLHHRTALKETAAEAATTSDSSQTTCLEQDQMYRGKRASPQNWQRRAEEQSQKRHAEHVDRYHQVHALHEKGVAIADIARQVGISRKTVYHYLRLDGPPERKRPTRNPHDRVLAPYEPHLLKRWEEGCHNGMQLWREICEQGYSYSRASVSRFIAHLRREGKPPHPVGAKQSGVTRPQGPTARQVALLCVLPPERLDETERTYLEQLRTKHDHIEIACRLSLAFADLLRERRGTELDAWIEQVTASGIHELERFAAGLMADEAAVRAGLTMLWSNGQTEGQVNRLKLLKRQMYGRANFDLLRQRVLRAA
jgi:transposase